MYWSWLKETKIHVDISWVKRIKFRNSPRIYDSWDSWDGWDGWDGLDGLNGWDGWVGWDWYLNQPKNQITIKFSGFLR